MEIRVYIETRLDYYVKCSSQYVRTHLSHARARALALAFWLPGARTLHLRAARRTAHAQWVSVSHTISESFVAYSVLLTVATE